MNTNPVKKSFLITLMFGTIQLFSACKKERSYPFRIINDSGYDITSLSFSGATSSEDVSINAGDTADNIMASYPVRFRLTPKLLCVSVNDFNNQGASFNVINNKPCIPFAKNDFNQNINTLRIVSSASADTLTFEFIIE